MPLTHVAHHPESSSPPPPTTTTTAVIPHPPAPPPPPPPSIPPSPSPLESLPTELLTRIALSLATVRDLKSLRLSSRRLAAATSYAYGTRGLSRVQFFFFRRSLRRLAALSRSEKWNGCVREVRVAKSSAPWRKKVYHEVPAGERELQVQRLAHRGGLGAGGEEGREDAVVGGEEGDWGVFGAVRVVVVEIRTGRVEDAQHHRSLPHLFAACPRLDTIHYDSLYSHQQKPMSAYIWAPPPPPSLPSLRRLRFTRSHFWHASALADFVRVYADVLTAVEVRDGCAADDWPAFLAMLRDECAALEEVVFQGNQCRFREVEVVWGDGQVDRGEGVERVAAERGVREALGEMIAGLRLGADVY